jgi:hypothetical protein
MRKAKTYKEFITESNINEAWKYNNKASLEKFSNEDDFKIINAKASKNKVDVIEYKDFEEVNVEDYHEERGMKEMSLGSRSYDGLQPDPEFIVLQPKPGLYILAAAMDFEIK